jgi:hypothetical protein
MAQRTKLCFGKKITGTKVTIPRTIPGLSIGGDVGFRKKLTFFYDIRYILNGQAYGKLSGNKN